MLLEAFPETLEKDRIGGVTGEMQASPDFNCADPKAMVNIVLQSEADHWMILGSIPLEKMRGEWNHYSFEIADPTRLKAMARLYAVRFQIQSEAPVSGEIYFDNLGFLMRGAKEQPRRKNILFIAVDDLKPVLGAYGEQTHTPAMDKLAGNGTLFLNAHCQQAVCGPTRASLLTGMRPDYTRVWDLKTQIRDIRPDIVTLPQHFKANGYVTAGVGKIFDPRTVDSGVDTVSWSLPFGKTWELDFDATHGPAAAHYQDPAIKALAAEAEANGISGWGKLNKYLLERDAWPAYESADVPDNAYDDGAIADKGVQWIGELSAGDQPFFIAVGFKKPHLPFVAPKKYWDLYDRDSIELAGFQKRAEGSPGFAYHTFPELRSYCGIPAKGAVDPELQRTLIHGYYACVSYIDAQVAKLMKALEEAGVADETVIVLWGDHGFHLGDHGLWCKHTNYEQATRVPLIFAGPGVREGLRNTSPVEFLDIFPTLCDLAGIDSIDTLQGTSLGPLLEGSKARVKPYAVSQYPRPGKMGYALRTERYRYVAWYKTADGVVPDGSQAPVGEELFDYGADPQERVNLIGNKTYADKVPKLRGALQDFLLNQEK
jgi:arylsulfatase A-like enzyme